MSIPGRRVGLAAVGIPAVPTKVYGSVVELWVAEAPRETLSQSKATSIRGTTEWFTNIRSKQLERGPMNKIKCLIAHTFTLDPEPLALQFYSTILPSAEVEYLRCLGTYHREKLSNNGAQRVGLPWTALGRHKIVPVDIGKQLIYL